MRLSRPIRPEKASRGQPAGSGLVMTGALDDETVFSFEQLKKRREKEDLEAVSDDSKQRLESLNQRINELQKHYRELQEENLSFDIFLKNAATDQAVEDAERERKEVLQMVEEIEKLKKEKAELIEQKRKVEREVQRHTVYRDIMEQILKTTTFKDVNSLAGQLERQLHLRDKLCQRLSKEEEQVDQLRKTMVALEDQHAVKRLQKFNELSQLQTELENTLSEALVWEKRWNHIEETAMKKVVLLGQIKMATLNLYEATDGQLGENEGVDINDTEKQLDKIKMFILDHEDIVKQYHTSSQRHSNRQKRNTGKMPITAHSKK
ncbi:coiled-coil domain-containing protein 42 homolog [Toxotes jaculatrix]|uniref:coiled-coil domain-containing protein 42 homolog n=1 Tax=Toxotes jaculatrix TaxID=941984 RepID=UPI001B3AA345|nr:coiled-coil domain-containing protein 42 homolog [Toxotes jaculatrix]